MDFSERKLTLEAAATLVSCPIESVHPYAMMSAPVYLRLQLNQKFVAVKGPLDFFTPEEIARLRSQGEFHFSRFVEKSVPFRDAGAKVRALLDWDPSVAARSEGEVALPPAPHELSDAVLHLTAPLWDLSEDRSELGIEPFFCVAFANELCDTLPESLLLDARERDVAKYELGVLASSWTVLAALTLGYHDRAFLERLRQVVFSRVALSQVVESALLDLDQLERLALRVFGAERSPLGRVTLEYLQGLEDRAARKLVSRLRRVERELAFPRSRFRTVFGDGGLIDG